MTPDQVKKYLEWLDPILVGGALVYLKQWDSWHNPVDNLTWQFNDCPIPERWGLVFDAPAPVQTSFGERAWRVPSISDSS